MGADDMIVARVLGREDRTVNGYTTDIRAGQGEDWMVPCDRGSQSFLEWETARQAEGGALPSKIKDLDGMEQAWDASRQRHTATLRRIGWLDQKGRVWAEVPSGKDYNGGSYTPLLIDVRGD